MKFESIVRKRKRKKHIRYIKSRSSCEIQLRLRGIEKIESSMLQMNRYSRQAHLSL